jgi:superfamily II RNA helicase
MRRPVSIAMILGELERCDLLPAIVFRSSRAQCDIDAERSAGNRKMHIPLAKQRAIKAKILAVIEKYEMDADLVLSHPQYSSVLTTGIGAHHAGQLLMWRLLLEELMAAGLLRVLVATGTVAAGVDFPARTVVVTAHSRRGAEGFVNFTSSEFQQMSGRAGRRGKDTVGFCIAAPSAYCDARVLAQIARKPPEPLESAYFPSPSTVLNLLRYRTVDGLQYTVERSLAAFNDRREAVELREQAQKMLAAMRPELSGALEQPLDESIEVSKPERKELKRIRRKIREANSLEKRQTNLLQAALSGLRGLSYVDGDNLSEKGFWAANLFTTLVLELSEIIERGILDDVNADQLIAIIASIAGDPYRQYIAGRSDLLSSSIVDRLNEVLESIKQQSMPGTVDYLAVLPDAAHTVLTWAETEDWGVFRGLLFLNGVAEGDAARLITQTAEQLNQLSRLRESHYELALLAQEARRRILRPPLTEVIEMS